MKGLLKSTFGTLEWKLTDNGVVSFKNPQGKRLKWMGASYSLVATLPPDGICRIVNIVCKLATETLQQEITTVLPEQWKRHLQTHPSILRVHTGNVREKILSSEKLVLWKILGRMEAQLAAFRMTLEALGK